MTISGVGRDVADDGCWQLPKAQREALTLQEKNENCRCLGVNLFNDDRFGRRCYFPGLQTFYDPAIDQPEPVQPPEPQLPETAAPSVNLAPPPPLPATGDLVAQQQFAVDYQAWVEQVGQAQEAFQSHDQTLRASLEQFRNESRQYQQDFAQYQHDMSEWQGRRARAIASGEQLLGRLHENFGHTYAVSVPSRYLAQVLISSALFFGILFLLKRKDMM
jgi:hypothetical protein